MVNDDAIVSALRGHSALVALLPDEELGIAHGQVLPGTRAPYVIVMDAGEAPAYAFGHAEKFTRAIYDVYAYAPGTDSQSAQEQAAEILGEIKSALHDQDIAVSGRVVQDLHYMGRRPSSWQTITDQEQCFRDGHQYLLVTGPTG